MVHLWPQAFLVDLDNTLHDYERAAHTARMALARNVEQQWGIASAVVLQRYEALLTEPGNQEWKTARDMRMARLERLVKSWPETNAACTEPLASLLESALIDAVCPFDGALEAIAVLKAIAPTLIVTEGYQDMQIRIAERLGLATSTRELLATKAHGVRKIDGSAYVLARERLGVPVASVVMMGDNWDWDVMASSRIGMWQIWVNGRSPERGPPPERFIGRTAGLCDVPGLLDYHCRAMP